jgi:integrase
LTDDHRHLLRALEARNGRDAMLFLTTIRGTPHSVKAFGAWFKKHVIAAGLPPDCTLHGLRKARASVLGELGWSSLKIGAWTGHTSLSEIERYTKKAVRRRMLEGPEQEQNLGNRVVAFSQNGEKTNENKAKG